MPTETGGGPINGGVSTAASAGTSASLPALRTLSVAHMSAQGDAVASPRASPRVSSPHHGSSLRGNENSGSSSSTATDAHVGGGCFESTEVGAAAGAREPGAATGTAGRTTAPAPAAAAAAARSAPAAHQPSPLLWFKDLFCPWYGVCCARQQRLL